MKMNGFLYLFVGRDSGDDTIDYSLVVACFAGGITAICILVVGVTLTLYRRNHTLQSGKLQTHVVRYATAASVVDTLGTSTVSAREDWHGPSQQQQQQMQLIQHAVSYIFVFINFTHVHDLLLLWISEEIIGRFKTRSLELQYLKKKTD